MTTQLSEEGSLELLRNEAVRDEVAQAASALQMLEAFRLVEAEATVLRESLSSLAHSQMNSSLDAITQDLGLLSGAVATKAGKGAAIESPEATDLATALTLLNELRTIVSGMNA